MKLEKCNTYNTLATMISLATIAVGAVAVAGKLMNPALGWIAVGLGSGTLLMQIPAKFQKNVIGSTIYNYKKGVWLLRRSQCQILLTSFLAAGLVTIGVLGVLNIISARTTGWAMIGSALASWAIHCCCNKSDPIAPFALLPPCMAKNHYATAVIPIFVCCSEQGELVATVAVPAPRMPLPVPVADLNNPNNRPPAQQRPRGASALQLKRESPPTSV